MPKRNNVLQKNKTRHINALKRYRAAAAQKHILGARIYADPDKKAPIGRYANNRKNDFTVTGYKWKDQARDELGRFI